VFHGRKNRVFRVLVKAIMLNVHCMELLLGELKMMQIRPFVRFRGAVDSSQAVHLKYVLTPSKIVTNVAQS
jgi:hypothetical protein